MSNSSFQWSFFGCLWLPQNWIFIFYLLKEAVVFFLDCNKAQCIDCAQWRGDAARSWNGVWEWSWGSSCTWKIKWFCRLSCIQNSCISFANAFGNVQWSTLLKLKTANDKNRIHLPIQANVCSHCIMFPSGYMAWIRMTRHTVQISNWCSAAELLFGEKKLWRRKTERKRRKI